MSKTSGVPADGWYRTGITLPEPILDALRDEQKVKGFGAQKIIATLALAIYLDLPEEVKDRLYLWGQKQAALDIEALRPESVGEQYRLYMDLFNPNDPKG